MGRRATDGLLGPGDPHLRPDRDLATARRLLENHVAHDAEQERTRARMLAFVEAHPDALLRSCRAGHLTASALVIDAAGRCGLLTLHAKLGRWLQLGGHCDGDGNLPGVALREAIEESGISGLRIDPRPIDLDVHRIPARPSEPAHLHLDIRFLVHAPPGAKARVSAESLELAWFAPAELVGRATDASLRRLFGLACG